MKSMKVILGLIYPILILLLLLNNCNGSGSSNNDTPPMDTTVVSTPESDDVVRQAEAVGATGALKITLLWDFHADIDLHVKEPNGNEIYYKENEDSSTGGYLDVDNREGGEGAAENIYWNDPPKGQYLVRLEYYDKAESGRAESGTCTIVVFQEGKDPVIYNVHMGTLKESKTVLSINID